MITRPSCMPHDSLRLELHRVELFSRSLKRDRRHGMQRKPRVFRISFHFSKPFSLSETAAFRERGRAARARCLGGKVRREKFSRAAFAFAITRCRRRKNFSKRGDHPVPHLPFGRSRSDCTANGDSSIDESFEVRCDLSSQQEKWPCSSPVISVCDKQTPPPAPEAISRRGFSSFHPLMKIRLAVHACFGAALSKRPSRPRTTPAVRKSPVLNTRCHRQIGDAPIIAAADVLVG